MAFHSYPQLIRKLFNAYRCGPPDGFTRPSSWPRVDHLVSRLPPLTSTAPCSDSLSLRLRTSLSLTSPATATRRLIMQKARRHPIRGSDRLQAHGFRVCFTPLTEVLFTFPSRYLCAIGLSVVFSLAGWSPQIPAEFLVLRGTQVPPDGRVCISRTGLSPSPVTLSCVFRYASLPMLPAVLQPRALP